MIEIEESFLGFDSMNESATFDQQYAPKKFRNKSQYSILEKPEKLEAKKSGIKERKPVSFASMKTDRSDRNMQRILKQNLINTSRGFENFSGVDLKT